MTTRKEMTRINRLVELIEKNGEMTKVDLVMASSISISYFDKLRPFLLQLYAHRIIYDKEKSRFVAIRSQDVTT